MKTCFKCGQGKPLADFYRHPRMADGHLNKCKQCTKVDSRQNRADNIDSERAYDRERSQQPHRIAKSVSVTAMYRDAHPERLAANNAVANAVRSGRLVKPEACWCCGSGVGVGGHHASYDRDMRLCVTWLCQACHKRVHEETLNLLHYTPQVMDNRTSGSPVHHIEITCPT